MRIVMTGGTSGLGRVAASNLLRQPGMTLTIGARGGGVPAGATALPLDLASLASVRSFVDALPAEPIDALILNAGSQRLDVDTRTEDGFESTFATNHLAHYLILRLLLPRLADGARVVITSSGTHDPAEKTGFPPPRHADAARLAHPEIEAGLDKSPAVAGKHAYSSSKLCNLMTAMTLAAAPEAKAGRWQVAAYDPGLTPGTGLARERSWPLRTLVWPLFILAKPFISGINTATQAGRGLADLALGAMPPPGRVYAALRKGALTWPDPSELARDAEARRRLWAESERLAGL